MKAKIRALIIIFIFCIFFAVTFVLLPSGRQVPGNRTTRDPNDTALMITDIPVSEIQALALSNSYGSFGIINNPAGIAAVSNLAGTFNIQEMRALVYMAGHLPGLRRLDNFSLPDAAYIANSLARFTLILAGGHENNFAILQKSPVSDDYLLFFEEQQSVFLISRSNAELFLRSPEDFLVP